jgi:hypothetical protein
MNIGFNTPLHNEGDMEAAGYIRLTLANYLSVQE